jgi:predicted TIM-barrel fold metal-dependent hydrolase
MKQGFKVMDSDMHIIEPPDLWQRYIAPEFKDQAPRGTTNSVADLGMIGPGGTPWGRNPKNVQHLGQDRRRGRNFARNQERFKPYEDLGWTGDTQLRAMDEEGIDVAVIYPSRGLFALTVPDLDPRLAAAMARAYNTWLYDFCAPDRQRLIGAGMISPFDVNDAVTESHRCVHELGFRGVFLRPNLVNGRNWHDPYQTTS